MAYPVYSHRFIAGTAELLPFAFAYTVPDGFVAIIRDVDGSAQNEDPDSPLILELNPTGAFGVGLCPIQWEFEANQSQGPFSWRGRQVVNAGETFDFSGGGALSLGGFYCSVVISGYLLKTA